MFGVGFGEILIILVIALIFLGPSKLPELAKSLGKGLSEFNKARQGFMDTLNEEVAKSSGPSEAAKATPIESTPEKPAIIEAEVTTKTVSPAEQEFDKT